VIGALFDLDGTLVDNMRIHNAAWTAVAALHGRTVSPERIQHDWAGKKNDELIPLMMGREVSAEELKEIEHQKESRYREQAAGHLVELPGTSALLERLRAAGYKLAVATAAPPENRALVLEGLKLRRFFDAVVGPEGAVRGKPAPDIFLAAARVLSVSPAQCVVFEDAPNGVRAGVAAGCAVIGVTTTVDAQALREAGATWTLPDFRSLPPQLEQAVFQRS
jgi:HAD superfamily hydrolase (TIGR01509 family)